MLDHPDSTLVFSFWFQYDIEDLREEPRPDAPHQRCVFHNALQGIGGLKDVLPREWIGTVDEPSHSVRHPVFKMLLPALLRDASESDPIPTYYGDIAKCPSGHLYWRELGRVRTVELWDRVLADHWRRFEHITSIEVAPSIQAFATSPHPTAFFSTYQPDAIPRPHGEYNPPLSVFGRLRLPLSLADSDLTFEIEAFTTPDSRDCPSDCVRWSVFAQSPPPDLSQVPLDILVPSGITKLLGDWEFCEWQEIDAYPLTTADEQCLPRLRTSAGWPCGMPVLSLHPYINLRTIAQDFLDDWKTPITLARLARFLRAVDSPQDLWHDFPKRCIVESDWRYLSSYPSGNWVVTRAIRDPFRERPLLLFAAPLAGSCNSPEGKPVDQAAMALQQAAGTFADVICLMGDAQLGAIERHGSNCVPLDGELWLYPPQSSTPVRLLRITETDVTDRSVLDAVTYSVLSSLPKNPSCPARTETFRALPTTDMKEIDALFQIVEQENRVLRSQLEEREAESRSLRDDLARRDLRARTYPQKSACLEDLLDDLGEPFCVEHSARRSAQKHAPGEVEVTREALLCIAMKVEQEEFAWFERDQSGSGWKYSPKYSSDIRRQRHAPKNSRGEPVGPHITVGRNAKSERCVHVFFEVDRQSQTITLWYCGKHLPGYGR